MVVHLPPRLLSLAALCVFIAATTGCAAEAQSGGGQGGADVPTLCLDLEDMSQAVTKARNLSAFSTPGDVKTTRAAIDNAFAAVEDSAEAQQVDVTALKKEVDKLDAFATRVSPGMTIGQSGSTIGAQAAVVAKEQAKVSEAAGCTPGS